MSARPAGAGTGLRVALANPVFWPEVRRGSERFLRDLADGLLAGGHIPRLVTSHPGPTTCSVEAGLEITRHWRPPDGRLRRRLFEEHLTHMPLTALDLLRGGDDIVHALHHTDAVAALPWRRRGRGPLVLSYMGNPHRVALANHRGRAALVQRAVRAADAIVALSDTAAHGFARWLGVEAQVIPPGVDLEVFSPAADVAAARAAEPTILCAAALGEPRKRVALLLAALELVRAEHPAARLILSRPPDPAAAAATLGLRGVATHEALARALPAGTELRDLDDRAALAAAAREAWVAALPSTGEAFGLVLVEAMACATPVVAARREALPEVVNSPRIGRFFDGDDPRALAGGLLEGLELSRDPATPGACRARAEEFSTDRCVGAYEALYAELLGS